MVSLAMFYILVFKTSNQQDAIQSINTLCLCQPVYGSQSQAHNLFMKMYIFKMPGCPHQKTIYRRSTVKAVYLDPR